MILKLDFFLMKNMNGIAIMYGVTSLLLFGGFAYFSFKMTRKSKDYNQ